THLGESRSQQGSAMELVAVSLVLVRVVVSAARALRRSVRKGRFGNRGVPPGGVVFSALWYRRPLRCDATRHVGDRLLIVVEVQTVAVEHHSSGAKHAGERAVQLHEIREAEPVQCCRGHGGVEWGREWQRRGPIVTKVRV